MEFHGFRTIAEYERACIGCGMTTVRVPFRKMAESGETEHGFVLITSLKVKTSTSLGTWHLFTVDERRELLDGIINGNDANYLGMLASHGWFPDRETAAFRGCKAYLQ